MELARAYGAAGRADLALLMRGAGDSEGGFAGDVLSLLGLAR